MSAPKRGLGRGLGVLLGETPRAQDAGLKAVRVDAIRPNPQQPRKTFEPAALAELEQSIRELGVLVPIIVRPLGSSQDAAYELIAGERRWRAAAAARLESIPAIVRDVDDEASLELALVENLQRQDLDPLEEAMGYQHLLEQYRFTQERLAERLGKSRPTVSNALRLLALSDAIKARLRSGALTVGHARALLALELKDRDAVAARIEREGLSVREVERLGERRKKEPAKPRAPGKTPDVEAVENRLRYQLSAPVAIVPTGIGGRIEIRYADAPDLARLVDTLLPDDV